MPERPDPPSSTSPDLEWVWQGYLSFWDRALLGEISYIQVQRYARDWGLPPGIRPIRGGDFFGDIGRLVNSVTDFIGRGINWVGDFFSALAQFPAGLFNVLGSFFSSIFWPMKDYLRDLANNVYYIFRDAGGWLWNAGGWLGSQVYNGVTWAGTTVYNGLIWAGNQVYSGVTWAGTTVYNGLIWAGNQVWSILSWLGTTIYGGVTWAGNQVWTGLTWLGNTIWGGISAAGNQAWSALTWLGTTVYNGLTWVGNQTWSGATYVVDHMWDGSRALVSWIVDNVFEIPGSVAGGMSGMVDKVVNLQMGDSRAFYIEGLHRTGLPKYWGALFSFLVALNLLLTIPAQLASIQTMPLYQEAARVTGAALMSQAQLRDVTLRGINVDDPAALQLSRYGFNASKVGAIMALWQQLPTPTDLVRFGVREVFTPEIAGTFGQYEDFPAEFGQWMAKLGFSDFWAKAYWAAHWDLPSATQGFEMFHRGIIPAEQLELLLRALDVMPFWRDKLIQINYHPVPLRQMRNMYAAGTLDDDEVRKNLRFLGYTPDDVERFVTWFKKDLAMVGKDVPSSVVLRAYSKRLLSRGEAQAALEGLDYHPDAVELLLDMEDLKVAEQLADLQEQVVKHDYKQGSITAAAAVQALAALGVPGERIALLVDLWTVEKAPRIVTLSAAEVQRALHEKVISPAEAQRRLHDLGYNEQDVGIKIALATPEPLPPEPPELTVSQLQAAAKRGYLATFAHVRADLDEFVQEGITTAAEVEVLHVLLVGRRYADADAWVLTALGFPEPKVPAAQKPKVLTAAQVLRAFKTGIVDATEVFDRLRELGYEDRDIAILLLENQPAGG